MILQPQSQVTLAAELIAMPRGNQRRELIRGELYAMPLSGSEHGRIAGRIFLRLATHVEANQLGETYAAETGFLIETDPDTVRAPDAAFVSQKRLDSVGKFAGAFLPLAPDLVVEVVSPSDSSTEVEAKADAWLCAGTSIVLVADPKIATLHVYRTQKEISILRAGETFSSGDVCGNWQLSIDDVFRKNS